MSWWIAMNNRSRHSTGGLLGCERFRLFGRPAVRSASGVGSLFAEEVDDLRSTWPKQPGKQQKQALDLYYDLLALKEAPMKILALISRQFNMLLQVKEMKMKGYQEQTIATQTGLNAYFLKKKYIPQASKFKLEQLQQALTACVEAEEAVKTGNMTDILSVELIIVSLSAA